jgi:hypothetical protein
MVYCEQHNNFAPPPLKKAMAYDGSMDAREYYTRLRAFNIANRYLEDNNNLPLPEDVPENVTLMDYQFMHMLAPFQ